MSYLIEARAMHTRRSCTDLIVTLSFQTHIKIKISKHFSKFMPQYAAYN